MMPSFPRFLSADSGDDAASDALLNVAIATIFAREVLEGCIIIGQYRTVIMKSDGMSEERKSQALTIVTRSSLIAAFFAVLVVIAIAVPLSLLGRELDGRIIEVIEGVSKVVAAVCIVQLSVKVPVWLGIYQKVSLLPWKKYNPNKKGHGGVDNLTNREIYFNVAWNIWREVAECGVFLIPFFLGSDLKAIPLSAVLGSGIALVLGIAMYVGNNRLENKFWLAFFMSGLTLMLSVGLFVGGTHEFEEVWGETPKVWKIEGDIFSHKKFPFVLLKPFGYSASRTILQITTFWSWLLLGLGMHYIKWSKSQAVVAQHGVAAHALDDDVEKANKSTSSPRSVEDPMFTEADNESESGEEIVA